MSVYFETQQTVIQSTPMADFSFCFTEGRFLLLNGQKHLRSVAENLISNKQKEPNQFIRNGEGTDVKNSQANISQQVITWVCFRVRITNRFIAYIQVDNK